MSSVLVEQRAGIHVPAPLHPGDLIFVTAPSSGVPPTLHARLDMALEHIKRRGFRVEEGHCLRTEEESHQSAPARARASELNMALLRDDVAAVMPPWGGERAIELLPHLQWDDLRRARPKWLCGYSDLSTLMLPLLLRAGWASAHGPNLMDQVQGQDDELTAGMIPLLRRTALAGAVQHASGRNSPEHADWAVQPDSVWRFTEDTRWRLLKGSRMFDGRLRGRLVGGCLDTIARLAGSQDGDVPAFVQRHREDGVLLYLENCEMKPLECWRALWSLRLAGWFNDLRGVLLGRSTGPQPGPGDPFDQQAAVESALEGLGCPVVADLDIGHRAPQLTLINGALAELVIDKEGRGQLTYL